MSGTHKGASRASTAATPANNASSVADNSARIRERSATGAAESIGRSTLTSEPPTTAVAKLGSTMPATSASMSRPGPS